MSMLAKVVSATGSVIDSESSGPARLVGVRCLSSGSAALTLLDAEQNAVVTVDTYTAPTDGNEIAVPSATSARIFAKSLPESDIVYNGGFDGDYGWTKGLVWAIAAGVASIDGSQVSSSDLYQDNAAFAENGWYRVTFTITRTAGTLTPYVNGTALTARSSAGTYTEWVKAGGTGTQLTLQAGSTFAGTVDNVMVEKAADTSAVLECSAVTGSWQLTFETV